MCSFLYLLFYANYAHICLMKYSFFNKNYLKKLIDILFKKLINILFNILINYLIYY